LPRYRSFSWTDGILTDRNAQRRLAEEIRGVCMFLKASDLGGQATAMYERLVGGSARVTRKAHKIAVCVYIVARQSNRPVTLTECAVAGNVETGAMCAEYLAAKRLLGITLDNTGVPELLVERLVHCVHADLASPAARGLKQRAFQLLKLAAKTNYTTGRQPQMVAVAAVTICAEALGAKETATSLHQRLCDCLSIKVSSTLNQRRKELLRVLLESKGVLPYDEGIVTAGNMLKHVNEILMIAAAFPVDADEEEDEDDDDNAKKRPRINYDERLAPQRSFPSNTAAAPAVEGSAFVDDNAPIDDDELDDYIRTPAEVASVISFRNL